MYLHHGQHMNLIVNNILSYVLWFSLHEYETMYSKQNIISYLFQTIWMSTHTTSTTAVFTQ